MKEILIIIGGVIIGIVVLLCLSSCVIAGWAEEISEATRKETEKKR